MGVYKLFFKASVEKDLARIPKKDLKRILRRIEHLSTDPRADGCEKLSGQAKYRLRQVRYRIVYSIRDDQLTVWVVKGCRGRW